MKNLILLFLVIFCSVAQAQITFQKTWGSPGYDKANYIKQTTDGGYVASGMKSGEGFYIIKMDSVGNRLWSKTYGIANSSYHSSYIEQTSDGGFIIAGFLNSGYNNYIGIIKTDNAGNLEWSKYIKGKSTCCEYPIEVHEISNGYCIVGGSEQASTSFGGGMLLIRMDRGGNILWSKNYMSSFTQGTSFQATNDGGFIICGFKVVDGNNRKNICLIKTDSLGNILWGKAYNSGGSEYSNSIQKTNDGGYVMVGTSGAYGAVRGDVYVLKVDGNGMVQWNKTYGGYYNDYGYSIKLTNDGGFIISGGSISFGTYCTDRDVYLIKTDGSGNLEWSRVFGDGSATGAKDEGYDVQQTSDGGYIIAGESTSYSLSTDVFIIKTDVNGNTGCYQKNPPTTTGSIAAVAYNFTPGIDTNRVSIEPATVVTNLTDSTKVICSGNTTFSSSCSSTPEILNCLTNSNGTASVAPIGGTPPYTYEWRNKTGNLIPGQTTATATGLSKGVYICTITDSEGKTTINHTVVELQHRYINAYFQVLDYPCSGENSGSLSIDAYQGYPPYTYAWNTSPVQTSSIATGLQSGTFYCTITDVIGCTTYRYLELDNISNIALNTGSSPASCNTCPDGSAIVFFAGGDAPYRFTWSPNTGCTTASCSGLLPGAYVVCVEDANNCSKCVDIQIGSPNGVDSLSGGADKINIYPNPASANLNIIFSLPVPETVSVILYNPLGQIVNQQTLTASNGKIKTEIDVSQLNQGLYLLSVQGETWTQNEKILKSE